MIWKGGEKKTFFIASADSNRTISDALREFENGGKLSAYNTDGVSVVKKCLQEHCAVQKKVQKGKCISHRVAKPGHTWSRC